MAKSKEKLTYYGLLSDMALVKDRCKKLNMNDEQIRNLKLSSIL